MKEKLSCIAVDDDKLFQTIIEAFILKTDFLDLKGVFGDAIEASQFLNNGKVDVIFLDIEMPFMSGLDFLKTLDNPPQIIILSSNKEYALDAFEYNVTDYLLKPLHDYSRFYTAAKRAKNNINNAEAVTSESDSLFVKVNTNLIKLNAREINYIEALGDYIKVATDNEVHVVYTTLKSFLDKLPKEDFLQIHRSYIVRIDKIKTFDGKNVIVNDKTLPVSRANKEKVLDAISTI